MKNSATINVSFISHQHWITEYPTKPYNFCCYDAVVMVVVMMKMMVDLLSVTMMMLMLFLMLMLLIMMMKVSVHLRLVKIMSLISRPLAI